MLFRVSGRVSSIIIMGHSEEWDISRTQPITLRLLYQQQQQVSTCCCCLVTQEVIPEEALTNVHLVTPEVIPDEALTSVQTSASTPQ